MIWIGFIDGADIASYYSAADAILFPYSRRLAASGPMAIAIGYEKDIVLSSIMKGENNYVFDFEDLKNTYDIKKERTWEKVAK